MMKMRGTQSGFFSLNCRALAQRGQAQAGCVSQVGGEGQSIFHQRVAFKPLHLKRTLLPVKEYEIWQFRTGSAF